MVPMVSSGTSTTNTHDPERIKLIPHLNNVMKMSMAMIGEEICTYVLIYVVQ